MKDIQLRPAVLLVVILLVIMACQPQTIEQKKQSSDAMQAEIVDTWIRVSPLGPIKMFFYNDSTVRADFGGDGSIDLVSHYTFSGDTLFLSDLSGVACPESGVYLLNKTKYYRSLDMIRDDCGGRIKFILGFWTTEQHSELEQALTAQINSGGSMALHLDRARIHLALGNSSAALKDLDRYLQSDTSNARAYLNRAATKMPYDLPGVVADCNRAIDLDARNMHAFFLRGLAQYDLGNQALACDDFQTAIDFGFSVLRVAEAQKCAEFW